MKKHRRVIPPWKRPGHIVWFVLALVCSCWLILHMPADTQRMKTRTAGATRVVEASGPLEADSAPRGVTSTAGPTGTAAPAHSQHQRTPAQKILIKLETFGRLFSIVGIAAFLGGLVEARRWHMVLARVMGSLTSRARLPEIVGLAMPTALCSNAAANSILVNSHAEGHIQTSALIAGGMMNSYLAYISHSIRVMLPVIAAIGLPGVVYFGMQFTGGLLVLLGVMLWNCWYVSRHDDVSRAPAANAVEPPLAWPDAMAGAAVRALSLLFRMVCMTVPLMLGIEWLLKNGAFAFWEDALPHPVATLFPSELLSVVAAQFGGLVQSSAVAANLRAEGLITDAQILLAMLVGSAVGNPVRALRRNLPSALAIFPTPVAFTVVLGMQLSRFLVTVTGIIVVASLMLYMS